MKTITSNEDYVRFEVFEGRINLDEAGESLLALTKAQLAHAEDELQNLKYAKASNLSAAVNHLIEVSRECAESLLNFYETTYEEGGWTKDFLTDGQEQCGRLMAAARAVEDAG